MSELKRTGAGLGAKWKARQRGRKDLPSVRAQLAQGHSQLDAVIEDGSAVSTCCKKRIQLQRDDRSKHALIGGGNGLWHEGWIRFH